jgi:hypothetical protein
MSYTINRMFGSAATAGSAFADLASAHFKDMYVVSREGNESTDDVVAKIMKCNVWKPDAKVLAKAVSEGKSLITVHAPFGRSREAMDLMAAHGPVDSGLSDPSYWNMPWDDATPMSCALQMPVLAKTRYPGTNIWGLPTLTKSPATLSGCLGFSTLSRSATPLSSKFGWGTISSNPTPLSSKFGMKTLSAAKVRKA